MHNIEQLKKEMFQLPLPCLLNGVHLQTFSQTNSSDEESAVRWLDLRRRAFARQSVGVRDWSVEEFRGEMMEKGWWSPEHLWFAESDESESNELLGAICLAIRGSGEAAVPVVHWLMVDPRHRRKGIATALLRQLELRSWELGYREILLETHSRWKAAGEFYRKQGFVPAGTADS